MQVVKKNLNPVRQLHPMFHLTFENFLSSSGIWILLFSGGPGDKMTPLKILSAFISKYIRKDLDVSTFIGNPPPWQKKLVNALDSPVEYLCKSL